MDVLFLGTAAAEGYPGIFCRCRSCLRAKGEGGRSIRRRSAILIDGDLLIDLPPDLYWSAISYNVNLTNLHSLLITHSHVDHLNPQILEFRKHPYALMPLPTLTLFCDGAIIPIVEGSVGGVGEARLRLRSVKPYRRYRASRCNIIPIPANHPTRIKGEIPLNYILEREGREILYASDTGNYTQEVLDFLLQRAGSLDAIIIECTMGKYFYEYHMNYESVLSFHQWAKGSGVLKRGGKFVVTHMAHDGCGTHSEVSAILRPHGITVAYDGLRVRI